MIAKYLRHIRKAAEGGGDAVAQVKLGMLHKTGEVVAQSDTEAVRWFKAAADQGIFVQMLQLLMACQSQSHV